ncbi:MAG TPA: DM13 domain-containing protein [Candidatus Limnocylindria bacterium]|nr:DM13 domain-containing protein [Candidatus Limnocylindria bacterium]
MEFLGELERIFATSLYPLRVPIAIGLVVALVVLIAFARRRGWFAAARRHPARTIALVLALLAVGLPVGWYLGSPLFIRTSLVEPAPSAPTTAMTPAPETAGPTRSGQFTGADEFHFGGGTASLIETAPGTWTLRFEDFSVRNGPDLFVYLSPNPAGYAADAIELGTLKATDGAFNYDIPAGTDLENVRSVIIWCKGFAVLFAVAPLS